MLSGVHGGVTVG